jgi:hypothetical protein
MLDNPSLKELLAKNPPVMRAKRILVVAWLSVAIYEYAPSTKTQKEEKRAVMGESCYAPCVVFKEEAEATPLGGV